MPLSRRDALLSAGTLAGAGMVAGRTTTGENTRPSKPSTDPVCLTDFEPLAKARDSAMAWQYVNGAAAKAPFWFQLEGQPGRGFTRTRVQRGESAGCTALGLTVDTPTAGARDRETRAKVSFPPLPNLEGAKQAGGEEYRAAENRIY